MDGSCLAENHSVGVFGIRRGISWLSRVCRRFLRICLSLLAIHDFLLQELEIFAKNFDGKTVKVDRLSTGFVYSMGLLLDFFVFLNHILLNRLHLVFIALNSDQFIIWLGSLDYMEDLQNLLVFIHDIDKAQFLFLIFANEAYQFTALLDLIQRFYKLVCKILDPLYVLVFDLDESVTNAFLPLADDAYIWLVFLDGFRCVCLNRFEFF